MPCVRTLPLRQEKRGGGGPRRCRASQIQQDGELLHDEIIPGLGDGCVEYTLDAHRGFFRLLKRSEDVSSAGAEEAFLPVCAE